MQKDSQDFLKKLMNTPSPSGYESDGRKVWRNYLKPFATEINGDFHGNSIAALNPKKGPRIMLAGHIDEIAFQVRYINKDGYVYFNPLGGFDVGIIPGRKVKIHTKKGDLLGVVGRKAIHLVDRNDREKATKIHDMYIDVGAKDKKEAEQTISIGDPITYENNYETLKNNLLVSKAFDDKVGAFLVAETLKNVSKRKKSFKASLFSVATVQEELGLRGAQTAAHSVDPQIGIAIDVTHATDTPDVDVKRFGDVKMGKGAAITRGPNINPKLFDMLIQIAKKHKIPYQIEANPRPTGTDANAIQVTRGGVATGLISIPCRYMHTYTEVVSQKDIEAGIKLLTEFCMAIDGKTNFTL